MTDYCSTAELKAYLRITDTVDDTELARVIASASRAVEQFTNRTFGVDDPAVERFYTWERDKLGTREALLVNDISTTTDLAVDNNGTAVTAAGYKLYPANALADGRPFEMIVLTSGRWSRDPQAIGITAKFGWAAVPDTVKQATLLQASRFVARRESPYGVAGSPDLGNEIRLLARVDADVAVMLSPYRRWWAAA